MLLDKNLFPDIESVDVNAENQGFGYFSICFFEATKRAHIHWYELTVKILAPAIINRINEDLIDLESYYRRVFIKNEDPVNLLFHFYKS